MRPILRFLMLALALAGCRTTAGDSTTSSGGVDPGQLSGAQELSRRVAGALLDPADAQTKEFNLGEFIGVGPGYRDLLPLIGQFSGPFAANKFQGGTPNPVNLLILHVALSNIAHASQDAAQSETRLKAPQMDGTRSYALDQALAGHLKVLAAGPDAPGRGNAQDAIWARVVGIWGFEPDEVAASEAAAWKSALGPEADGEAALLTALMQPYFLIEQ